MRRYSALSVDLLLLLVVLFLAASTASAATLNVIGGQLFGASGVIVDGSSYNVEFLDGTCIALYDGCNDVSDFTFQTEAAAVLASQALLDQVFVDSADLFDTDPTLTNGCTNAFVCGARTGYGFVFSDVSSAIARNEAVEDNDVAATGAQSSPAVNSAVVPTRVWAVWSPVP